MGSDFEIVYNPGASNRVADALSRRGESMDELSYLCSSFEPNWEDIDTSVEQDAFWQP